MKEIYTLNEFFEEFKKLPNSYKIEQVHQLLNKPDAKATHRVKFRFKHFKLIIMTTSMIAILSAILFWVAPFENANPQDSAITNSPQMKAPSIKTENELFPKKIKVEENKETAVIVNSVVSDAHSFSKKQASDEAIQPENKIAQSGSNLKNLVKNRVSLPGNKMAQLKETYWPEDTIIDGNQFIITLTNEELEELGFTRDDKGFYYKNLWKGDTVCSIAQKGQYHIFLTSRIHEKNKKGYTFNNFYPVVASNTLFNETFYSRLFEYDFAETFPSQNDTLLPVLINRNQLNYGFNDVIYWFNITDELFKHLPERYAYLQQQYKQIKNNKKHFNIWDLVEYKSVNITEGAKMVELTKPELERIGFVFKEDNIILNSYRNDSMKMNFEIFKYGVYDIRSLHIEDNENNYLELVYLTNENGHHVVQWGDETVHEKYQDEYLLNKIQYLVPVLVRKENYPNRLGMNFIFWFDPSEDFFNAVPYEIGNQLQNEYYYITAKTEDEKKLYKTSCTYFEACRSSLNLDNFRLYPNPTNGTCNIEFSLSEEISGSISLLSVTGEKLKTLLSTTNFHEGNNFYSLNVTGFNPGIYMVIIESPKGFKTQRLIISQ